MKAKEIIKKNFSLKKMNSWKIDAKAKFFCEPSELQELKNVVSWALQNEQEIYILGGGSNILINDNGVDGLVISTKNLNDHKIIIPKKNLNISRSNQNDLNNLKKTLKYEEKITYEEKMFKVEALSGFLKSSLASLFKEYNLAPALFLNGIPGNIGGGVVTNAGIKSKKKPFCFKHIVEWIEVLKIYSPDNIQLEKILAKDIIWKYRLSKGWQKGIIYKIGFSCKNERILNIKNQINTLRKKRKLTQPLDTFNCGSVFKNPSSKISAGFLIEKAGLKGYSIGDAEISGKHANFIINRGKAKADDIYGLILFIQNEIKKRYNINLKNEVHFFGYKDKK